MRLRERIIPIDCVFAKDASLESLLDTFQIYPPLGSQVRPQFARSAFLRAVLRSRGSKDVDSERNTNF